MLLLLDSGGPLTDSLPPFITRRPGIEQGRVDPDNFEPTEGDWAFILGTDNPGWENRFEIGDKFNVGQLATPGPVPSNVLRYKSRHRGPSRMPAVSGVEPFVLVDGQTLILKVDEQAQDTITFSTAQFVSIGAATALEVRDAIASQIVTGVPFLTGTGAVGIQSEKRGRRSRVEIIGGTATALNMKELAWKFSLLVNDTETSAVVLKVGQTRDLVDLSANLSAFTAPFKVVFRLELITL